MAHARLGTEYSTAGESVLGVDKTRAFELRDRATDDEKFFITATYHRQVTGNLEQALQAFDLWAQTYPRTFNMYGLASGFVTKGSGRYEGCVERAAKAEAADPSRHSAISMPLPATISIGSTKLRRRSSEPRTGRTGDRFHPLAFSPRVPQRGRGSHGTGVRAGPR